MFMDFQIADMDILLILNSRLNIFKHFLYGADGATRYSVP